MGVSYAAFLEPEVHAARETRPGNLRQRVRRAIGALATAPRPPESIAIDVADLDLPTGVELRRIRLERWRIVYAVCDAEQWVWVLAVRRRPPSDYEDLPDLITAVMNGHHPLKTTIQ